MNNKLLIAFAGALALGFTLPAFAGPDWAVIEKARKDKQATQLARHGDVSSTQNCPPEPPVLLLDHGPRAQTTPYVNQQRKERYEAQVKACEAKK